MAKPRTEVNEQRELREMICQTLERLDHLTEKHRSERHYHFRVTNLIVKISAAIMLVIAVFNVLYAYDFFLKMLEIVDNVSLLEQNTQSISKDMDIIVKTMRELDGYMTGMDQIESSMVTIGETLPRMNLHVTNMVAGMGQINTEMVQMTQDVQNINGSFNHIASGVEVMRFNVNQISRPMGMMNPFMP